MLGFRKLLIVYCDYGRLGNRVHTHVNALAWCIENNYNLINLSFCKYSYMFKSDPRHKYGIFQQEENLINRIFLLNSCKEFARKILLSDKWIVRLSWFINQIRSTESNIIEASDINSQIHNKKINIIRNWDINCSELLKKHKTEIKNFLTPTKRILDSSANIFNPLNSKYGCIIGVHARRGDYADYLDGIYYYTWESYITWAKETKKILEKKNKDNVGIIICSDEKPPSSLTKDEFVHFSTGQEIMEDINILSMCDYNLGPPSSFGTWVSWYGEVPRLVLSRDTKVISIDQFKVSKSC